MKLIKLACPSCGAPLNVSGAATVLQCPFCDMRTVLSASASVTLSPGLVAPFRVSREQFELALLEFLADGDLTPDDIFDRALVTERVGVFLPFYELKGELRATFTASAGYEREEKTHYVERDGSGREKRRTRSETVVDWRPMSGEASEVYSVWLCASQSLADTLRDWSQEQAARCGDLQELTEEHIGSYVLEDHAFSDAEALDMGGRELVLERARRACKDRVPGDRVKDLRVDLTTRDEEQVAVHHAFWLATFVYAGQSFAFGVNGRDAGGVEGERPVDTEREQRIQELGRPFKIAAGISLAVFVLGWCFGGVPSAAAVLIGLPLTLWLGWRGKQAQAELVAASRARRSEVLERIKRGQTASPGDDIDGA